MKSESQRYESETEKWKTGVLDHWKFFITAFEYDAVWIQTMPHEMKFRQEKNGSDMSQSLSASTQYKKKISESMQFNNLPPSLG